GAARSARSTGSAAGYTRLPWPARRTRPAIATRLRTTAGRACGVIARFTGEPGAYRRQFLAGGDAAFTASGLALLRALRPRDIAVDFASRWPATALAATWREIVRAHAIERGEFASLAVMRAGPGLGRLFGRTHLGDRAAPGTALMQHRLQGKRRLRRPGAGQFAQRIHSIGRQRFVLAGAQAARQFDIAVADAFQAAHQKALRIPQAAYFAVAAFAQHHAEPAVAAAAIDDVDFIEARRTVFQLHAGFQQFQGFIGNFAVHAAQVFAL